jgi:uncharacterized DUF497 family protein
MSIEDPDAHGEQRFVATAKGNAGALLVIVYSESKGECRLISARRATRRERKAYEG